MLKDLAMALGEKGLHRHEFVLWVIEGPFEMGWVDFVLTELEIFEEFT